MSSATATVIDKATAFKNSVTGANLNKIVCKASSREMLGPKKKHVDCEFSFIINCYLVYTSTK